jgi:hypothetical protein
MLKNIVVDIFKMVGDAIQMKKEGFGEKISQSCIEKEACEEGSES